MKRWILGAFFILLLRVLVVAQSASERVDKLADAIAHAEGYGKRGTIPTRYHNPGDIKAVRGRYPGQLGVGKANHVIFRTDRDGWRALREQIRKIADGRSKQYNLDMTLAQMGKHYAARSKVWTSSVTKRLGVPASTTLREYLFPVDTFELCGVE